MEPLADALEEVKEKLVEDNSVAEDKSNAEDKEPNVEEKPRPEPFTAEMLAAMKDVHPQRNVFKFDSQIVISSNFDSGNLQLAEECPDLISIDLQAIQAQNLESAVKGKKKKKKGSKPKNNDSDQDETYPDAGSHSGSDQDGPSTVVAQLDFEECKQEILPEQMTQQEENVQLKPSPEEEQQQAFDTGSIKVDAKINDDIYGFNIWISPDSLPFVQGQKQRAQFYFSVTGLPQPTSFEKRRVLRFCVKNMSNHTGLLKSGHRPVHCSISAQEYTEVFVDYKKPMYKLPWQRLHQDELWIGQKRGEEGLEVIFDYTCNEGLQNSDYVIIAYVQPFSFNDIKLQIDDFASKMKSKKNIYYHQSTLVKSCEGLPMDIITVSSTKTLELELEPDQNNTLTEKNAEMEPGQPIDDPAGILLQDSLPMAFPTKQTVYISCRVHTGETPASYFLQGIFDFLSNHDSVQTQMILKQYVFKFVPCLNPDGVFRGYWRNDIYGTNLNRVYADPDPVLHPTVYASKAAVLHEHTRNGGGKLHAFIDLHGHCNKKGCFVFGNSLKECGNHDQFLFAKVLSLNCVNFDSNECGFNDADNNKKDKRGDSRNGSSRSQIFQATGLPYVFTLEGNYATGLRINTLQARQEVATGKRILKEDSVVQDTSSAFYAARKIPIYTSEVFIDVGKSVMITLLDLACINPITRLLKSSPQLQDQQTSSTQPTIGGSTSTCQSPPPQETIREALERLRADIKRDLEKPSIKEMKKKFGKKKKSKKNNFEFELVLKEDQKPDTPIPTKQVIPDEEVKQQEEEEKVTTEQTQIV